MTTGRYREEVFNVLLALLLHQRGVVTAPEQSFQQAVSHQRRVPDVLVDFRGLRTVIEGKVDDQPDEASSVTQQTRDRVEKGVAHIGVAVLYPGSLRQTPFSDLSNALTQCTFRIAIFSEATEPGQTNWSAGNLDYLADLLRRTFHELVQEDVVSKAASVLEAGVSEFARSAFTTQAMLRRASQILGIGEPARRTRRSQTEDDE
jgi:hypothetical protein